METKVLEDYDGPPRATGRPPGLGVTGVRAGQSSGAWIWFVQRVSAVAMLVLAALHWHSAYSRRIQLALLAALLIHAAAGLRVMLMEYGKISTKYQGWLFGVFLAIGGVVFVLVYLRLF